MDTQHGLGAHQGHSTTPPPQSATRKPPNPLHSSPQQPQVPPDTAIIPFILQRPCPHQLPTPHNKNSTKTSIIPLALAFKSIEQMERIRLKKSQEGGSVWGLLSAAVSPRWVTAAGSGQLWRGKVSPGTSQGLLPDQTKKWFPWCSEFEL